MEQENTGPDALEEAQPDLGSDALKNEKSDGEDVFKDAEGDDSTQITSSASQNNEVSQAHLFFHKIDDHGEVTPYPGSDPDEQLFLHPEALPAGGMAMRDMDGVVPAAIKEIIKKVASQLIKGKFADVTRTPSPAYIHHPYTTLGICKNDLSNAAKTIKKAAKTSEPLERMKGVVTYYV